MSCDVETGKPVDKSYLECELPEFLKESIAQMERGWKLRETDPTYLTWDCDWCELASSINIAEVEQIITPEQAWYLREKYLRMEKEDDL